ncbi:LytTR family transcriptional regulator DNA-binding domain-containing protein [Clostridioides mangenotii]|uniref:LytTR family DNA-binding domain-containing protein n=1 Tax=Metaclostridioides mangenotii TaxID=1540 RepID=UPI001C116676|nr:LytTR family DNA-binding domain-containing protein [Clostridioides mangenotii]MBU5307461.1 LytTR family transcriptional regulator DNA-binding domain-containing protein [Clostridioides mangenotii]
MKIIVEHTSCEENKIILKCAHLDDEMLEILAFLKERTIKLLAHRDGEVFMLMPDEIFYAETLDGRTILYTKDDIFYSQDSLAHLETKYSDMGYIRIGKSQPVNLRYIKKLKNMSNRRIEVTLKSDEKLIVSRHYIQEFKSKLGII